MAEKKEDSQKWAFFRDFIPALKQQPAYLLIFGIVSLFFFIAISTAIGAAIQGNAQLGWMAFSGLLASLIAAVVVIWRVHPPAATGRAAPPSADGAKKTSSDTAIRVLQNNREMFHEVRDFLKRSDDSVQKVIVVQYSGRNVKDPLGEILDRPGIEVEIYLAKPADWCINEHQKNRIIEFCAKFRNEFRRARNRNWRIYMYDAPGSVRAVLIKGHVLFLGPYLYEIVDTLDPNELDIRGGDEPLLMVPSGNPGFDLLAQRLEIMVEHWKHTRDYHGNVTATPYESEAAHKA